MNIEYDPKKIGPVIRRAMHEAIAVIREQAATFIAESKTHYDGVREDIVTTADRAAQEVYITHFTKYLPGFGLVGEEDGLRRPCTIPHDDVYITIDPLDGTKAFARGQSHGVGTMVGVVRGGKIVAGFVGDVNTGEIYGFDPENPVPIRTRFGVDQVLASDTSMPLARRYVMSNTSPTEFSRQVRKILFKHSQGGLCKDVEVLGGSYGTFFARLWKGEVAILLLDPAHSTPWDEVPVLGISKALGVVYFRINPETLEVHDCDPAIPHAPVPTPYITVAVLPGYAGEVENFLRGMICE
ncbi:MAG: hypothetical protein HZA80_00630 [Candidatus Taylorbacteria bacterium]|nr:hypothetical protein [Candidatus Taylorbacteria bacterium]